MTSTMTSIFNSAKFDLLNRCRDIAISVVMAFITALNEELTDTDLLILFPKIPDPTSSSTVSHMDVNPEKKEKESSEKKEQREKEAVEKKEKKEKEAAEKKEQREKEAAEKKEKKEKKEKEAAEKKEQREKEAAEKKEKKKEKKEKEAAVKKEKKDQTHRVHDDITGKTFKFTDVVNKFLIDRVYNNKNTIINTIIENNTGFYKEYTDVFNSNNDEYMVHLANCILDIASDVAGGDDDDNITITMDHVIEGLQAEKCVENIYVQDLKNLLL